MVKKKKKKVNNLGSGEVAWPVPVVNQVALTGSMDSFYRHGKNRELVHFQRSFCPMLGWPSFFLRIVCNHNQFTTGNH